MECNDTYPDINGGDVCVIFSRDNMDIISYFSLTQLDYVI